jgi:hypothetical protein
MQLTKPITVNNWWWRRRRKIRYDTAALSRLLQSTQLEIEIAIEVG